MKKKCVTDTVALKKLMIDNDFKTIGSLALSANINRTTLGKILDGKAQPSADTMNKLIIALSIPPQEAGNIFFGHNLRTA